MKANSDLRELYPSQLDSVSGGAPGLGVYRPGRFQKEAKAFFRECVGNELYERAMCCDAARLHHYVPARVYLSQADWEKFCWIEQYGTLDGFPA